MKLKLVSVGEMRALAGQPETLMRLHLVDEATNAVVDNIEIIGFSISRGETVQLRNLRGQVYNEIPITPER